MCAQLRNRSIILPLWEGVAENEVRKAHLGPNYLRVVSQINPSLEGRHFHSSANLNDFTVGMSLCTAWGETLDTSGSDMSLASVWGQPPASMSAHIASCNPINVQNESLTGSSPSSSSLPLQTCTHTTGFDASATSMPSDISTSTSVLAPSTPGVSLTSDVVHKKRRHSEISDSEVSDAEPAQRQRGWYKTITSYVPWLG